MNYLVTGVAGFIGAAVAVRLLEQGHTVIGLDNLTTGTVSNIPQGVHFFQSDCQDRDVYARLVKSAPRVDAIFHIAGQSSGEISFDDPAYDLRTNAESTLHLLQYALTVGCTRMIYASTMSVYGIKPDKPIAETEELCPQSFYGVGKIASEHYLRLYEQFGIHSTALRLFNVYGPGQNLENMRQGMVSIFMAMMVRDGHIHVKGSPDRYRDFVYIDDVVAAFLLCLHSPDSIGKAINIAGTGKTTIRELLDAMAAIHTTPVSVEFSGHTAGDIHGIHADITLARNVLSYAPKVSLTEGLTKMYNWVINA